MSYIDPGVEVKIGRLTCIILFNGLSLHKFQKASGKSLNKIINEWNAGEVSIEDMSALLWAGTQCHDPAKVKRGSHMQLEDFLAEVSPRIMMSADVQAALAEALQNAMPEPDDGDEDDKPVSAAEAAQAKATASE